MTPAKASRGAAAPSKAGMAGGSPHGQWTTSEGEPATALVKVMDRRKGRSSISPRPGLQCDCRASLSRCCSTEPKGDCHWVRSAPSKRCMLEILDGRQFGTLITLITIYALFGDDMRLWLTSKPSDNIFYGLSAVAFAFFAFEFMTNSCFRPGFASPPSFYFWLDLLATLSLLPEIGWIWDPVQSYLEGSGTTTSADLSAQIRAGRAARAGSKAGRVVRIVRLIRLVRVFKLYKHCRRARHLRQAQRDADAQDVSEHAGLITDEAPRFSVVEQSPFGAKSKDSPVVVGGSHRSARVAPERVNSGELPHVPSMRRAKLLVGAGQGATGQPAVLTPKH